MPITIDEEEALCLVHLVGDINVSSAAEFKEVLLHALASGKEIQFNLERATDLDITALQLLHATERKQAGLGKRCQLIGAMPPNLADLASDAGFEKFPIL